MARVRDTQRVLRGWRKIQRYPEREIKLSLFKRYDMRNSDTLPQHYEIMEKKQSELIYLGHQFYEEFSLIRI